VEKEDDGGVSGKGEEGGVTEGDETGRRVGETSTSSVVIVDVGESSSTDGLLLGMGDSQDL
jgi:hypothetical protein